MGNIDALGGVHGVISHDLFDFNALNAPFGIPFIHRNLGRVVDFHAGCGRIPGKRTGIADMDTFFHIRTVSKSDHSKNQHQR